MAGEKLVNEKSISSFCIKRNEPQQLLPIVSALPILQNTWFDKRHLTGS
jgi:hypothetical protein